MTEKKQIPVAESNHVQDRLTDFWALNGKKLTTAVVAIALIIGGYFAYKTYIAAPKEDKAAEAMWKAEEYYRTDSFRLALNGDGQNLGFLKIISRFGGTKAGDLAKFYAGSSYLNLGDFNNAIKYLKDFSTNQVEVKLRATGLLGDAYAETGKKQEAIEQYKKAGTVFEEDDVNSPEYLFRAALLLQESGKNKEAISLLHQIKDKYPNSQRAFDVDKYLGKLGDLN
jgi:predicted negative regulator of RcsB-dependent stress response